jgi:hypothetical protein
VRIAKAAVALALLALGCATARPPEVDSFAPLPGFQPNEEFVIDLNRKLPIMAEGSGVLTSGQHFYYIAYLTREQIADVRPGAKIEIDPLWDEMQALWNKRRAALDPAQYAFVILDARVFPGTPGSKTRRVTYTSEDGHWNQDLASAIVFEEPDGG